jgi:hydroxybutyrate-dimer hydrolase
MPCGFHYAASGMGTLPGVADPVTRASWWADASGIPPGNGVGLWGGISVSPDPTLVGEECLRALWTGDNHESQVLHASIAATTAKLPRADLPLWVLRWTTCGRTCIRGRHGRSTCRRRLRRRAVPGCSIGTRWICHKSR